MTPVHKLAIGLAAALALTWGGIFALSGDAPCQERVQWLKPGYRMTCSRGQQLVVEDRSDTVVARCACPETSPAIAPAREPDRHCHGDAGCHSHADAGER